MFRDIRSRAWTSKPNSKPLPETVRLHVRQPDGWVWTEPLPIQEAQDALRQLTELGVEAEMHPFNEEADHDPNGDDSAR